MGELVSIRPNTKQSESNPIAVMEAYKKYWR